MWPLSTRSAEARRHVELGERYTAADYREPAYEEFERAVAADTSLAYAYAMLSTLTTSAEDGGRYKAAASARMATATPAERANIEHIVGGFDSDLDAAMKAAKELTMLEPRNPRSWLAVAESEVAPVDVRAALRKAIDVDSSYAPSYFLLGRNLFAAKPRDLAQAEHYIETGVRLWPTEPLSFFTLGDLRRAQGRFDDAVAAYSRAIALDPQYGNWYEVRAHAQLFAGRYDLARADYAAAVRKGLSTNPNGTATRRAQVSVYKGQPDSTLADLHDVEVAIDGMRMPNPAIQKFFALNAELMISVRHGRLDVARHADSLIGPVYRAAIGGYSVATARYADGFAALAHGLVAVYSGDYAAAEHFADEITRIRAPDIDPFKDQPAHFLRGEAARLRRDYPSALRQFAQADSNGVSVNVSYSRGLALEAMGRRDEARAAYQAVADYHFNSADNAAVHYDAVAKLAAMK